MGEGSFYEAPPHGWTCFHCGETFTTPGAAADHFGFEPSSIPGCRIKAGEERGLLMALRRAEEALAEALATQPDSVPELPPYVKHCDGDWYRIEFANGDSDLMDSSCDPDDLDRIAEAARILAARERARRAGR